MTGSIPDTDGSPNSTNQIIEDLWNRIQVQIGEGLAIEQVSAAVSGGDSNSLKTALDTRYAPVVQTAVLTRDSSGRIMSAVENGVTVTYTRDSLGRIASETRNGKTTTYTRDGAGRVSGWATA